VKQSVKKKSFSTKGVPNVPPKKGLRTKENVYYISAKLKPANRGKEGEKDLRGEKEVAERNESKGILLTEGNKLGLKRRNLRQGEEGALCHKTV